MIIHGGQVFILDADTLQGVTVTGCQVVLDVTENASLEDMVAYLNNRAGGCTISGCSFVPLSTWAKQRAHECTSKAKSEPHLDAAPIMKRARKFFRLGAAS